VFKRIDRKTALALEPVEERIGEVSVFVQRLGGKVALLAAPGGEGVGIEIVQARETALSHELLDARLHGLLIVRAAAKGLEVGKEIVQMRERSFGEGIALLRGQGQPGLLAFFVLHDGKQFGMGGLLVGGVERHVLDVEFPGEAEASAIGALDDELAVLAALGFVGVGDHLRWDFRRWR